MTRTLAPPAPDRPPTVTEASRREPGVTRTAYLAIFGAALLVRFVTVAVVDATHHAFTYAPDQHAYMSIATWAAHGQLAGTWSGFGEQLYRETFAYSGPLTALVWIFGGHLVVGQLLAVVFGALAIVFTVGLAAEFVRPRVALAVGGVAILWPSQVLWSSLALRDSMVWASLAGVGFLAARLGRPGSDRRAGWLLVSIVVCLVALSHLRRETFLAALWATTLALLVLGGRRRRPLRLAAVGVLVILPLATGYGVAGVSAVTTQASRLGTLRGSMAEQAQSAFVNPSGGPGGGSSSGTATGSHRAAPSPATTSKGPTTTVPAPSLPASAVAAEGENSTAANLHYLPHGILAFLMRPYPWEHSTSQSSRLAKIETIAWLPVYVLALIGALVLVLRRISAAAFPLLCVGGLVVANALIQGNLGTAFRERGQILFGLLFSGAVAAEWAVVAIGARLRRP